MVLESGFPPDRRVEKEIIALTDAGHEVSLACSAKTRNAESSRWGKAIIHRKFMSTFIYKSSAGCLKFPFYFRFWRKYILGLLSMGNYDVIHIHDLPLASIGAEAKKKLKIRLAADLHENYPALLKDSAHTQTFPGTMLFSYGQWTDYEKKYLPEADLIFTVVEEAGNRIEKLGVDKNKISIVSNTFDIENDSMPFTSKLRDDFTIFYGGAINRHRGLQIVLEAVKLLSDKNICVKLMIVGTGSYKRILQKKTNNLGIDSLVTFYGQKPYREMLDLLAEADAGIIPHLRTDNNDASSPNKIFEYMYLKKPVISSDCISLKRIITETDSGYIYRSDSPEKLAELLEKLKDDRKILHEKGENGHRAVISKYNWNFDRKRLLTAYNLLEKNPAS